LKVLFLSSAFHDQSFGRVLEDLLENDDTDTLACIYERIKHIVGLRGHPQPPAAKPLREVGEGLCEIRSKHGKEDLLRIYYFVDKETDSLILLNVIIKPDGHKKQGRYDGKSGKKIERTIKESVELALKLKTNYLTSKHDYQIFPL